MLHIVAVITAKPGKRQAILDELHPRIPQVLAEAGCIEYFTTVDADVVGSMHTDEQCGPDTFVIIEKWESLHHLEAHSTAPFVTEYLKLVDPLMERRLVHFLQPTQ